VKIRHNHPRFDWMNANSFHDNEAETDGKEVIPSRIANRKATTPVGKNESITKQIINRD
jgi:hypothetical protein